MDLNQNSSNQCSYCLRTIENDDFLNCLVCKQNVHIKCLKRPGTPGGLLGDVFFDFTCCQCSGSLKDGPSTSAGPEKFVRQNLNYLMIIILAIYNLSIKSKGLSYHGYFHWRTHIINFIEKNAEYLFDSNKRPKHWIGSVTGALSNFNPKFFLSGYDVLKEQGWWKLTYSNQTPKFCYNLYTKQKKQNQQQQATEKRTAVDDINDINEVSNSGNDAEFSKRPRRMDSDEEIVSCQRTTPYMGQKSKRIKKLNNTMNNKNNKPLNTIQSNLMDFIAENLSSDDLFNEISNSATRDDILPLITPTEHVNLFDLASNIKVEDAYDLYDSVNETIAEETVMTEMHEQNQFQRKLSNNSKDENLNDVQNCQPRIIQVTNFQIDCNSKNNKQPKTIKKEVFSDQNDSDDDKYNSFNYNRSYVAVDGDASNEDEKEDEECSKALSTCEKSFFTVTKRRALPWLNESIETSADDCNADYLDDNADDERRLTLMSEYEEKELCSKLRKIFLLEQKYQLKIPSYIRRFYRKLVVREMQRTYSKSLFNLDSCKISNIFQDGIKSSILDRYQLLANSNQNRGRSFYARIAGSFEYELFESPYTSRVLHPFIYRNSKCFPHWLKLMCELQYAVNGMLPTRSTIDFCYVRPNHIPAVNALLQSEFWPGIDMSECLSYPDFSVVALYKKLVIGCAFLVPDVRFNEAYISFMAVRPNWQRCGIASFMLYHLIQTCMSKDITLHVSATNPAVCLYQKFGFKIEEIVLDFYEKYLPIDAKHSRNAFFLRLMR